MKGEITMGNRNMQSEGFGECYEGGAARRNLMSLFSLEYCRERIYYRLVSMKRNERLKEQIPCIPFLDMLVTFHVLVQRTQEQLCSMRITNEIAEEWGIDTKTLFSLAKNNTNRLFPERFCRLRDMVDELCGRTADGTGELSAAIQEKWYMEPYILTNAMGINGAAAVLYHGILRLVSDRFDGDCYVLPSSVHELLVLPTEGIATEEELRRMVKEVNDTYVSGEDFLSNQVYRYDRKRDSIKICSPEKR